MYKNETGSSSRPVLDQMFISEDVSNVSLLEKEKLWWLLIFKMQIHTPNSTLRVQKGAGNTKEIPSYFGDYCRFLYKNYWLLKVTKGQFFRWAVSFIDSYLHVFIFSQMSLSCCYLMFCCCYWRKISDYHFPLW